VRVAGQVSLAVAVGLVVLTASAAAAQEPVRGGLGAGEDEVDLVGEMDPITPSEAPPLSTPVRSPSAPSTAPPQPPPPPMEPYWGVHPVTGEPCLALLEQASVAIGGELDTAWRVRIDEMLVDPRLDAVESRYCTGTGPVPVADPSAAARAFARSIPIPEPTPEIAPGIAVTGLPAYLVIANQDGFTVSETLAGFGPMQVTLEPMAFDVDWGDGATQRIDDGRTGVSWEQSQSDPSQAIDHIYIARDLDTVVTVDAEWTAAWSVGGFSGVVSGLSTDTSFALPVQEYRAVRVSP
jgi:hypothetical protein